MPETVSRFIYIKQVANLNIWLGIFNNDGIADSTFYTKKSMQISSEIIFLFLFKILSDVLGF